MAAAIRSILLRGQQHQPLSPPYPRRAVAETPCFYPKPHPNLFFQCVAAGRAFSACDFFPLPPTWGHGGGLETGREGGRGRAQPAVSCYACELRRIRLHVAAGEESRVDCSSSLWSNGWLDVDLARTDGVRSSAVYADHGRKKLRISSRDANSRAFDFARFI